MHICNAGQEATEEAADVTDWQSAWQLLMWTTLAAGCYTVLSSLKPFHWLRSFPVLSWLGFPAATAWGWELAPSMGYIGQGESCALHVLSAALHDVCVSTIPMSIWHRGHQTTCIYPACSALTASLEPELVS